MKKFLLAAFVIFAGMYMTSCDGNSNSNDSSADSTKVDKKTTYTLVDSLSMKMGTLYGCGIAFELSERAKQDSLPAVKIDKKRFISGLESILEDGGKKNNDTQDPSFVEGMKTGMQVLDLFNNAKQQLGFDLNRELFIKHFKKAFGDKKIASTDVLMQMQMAINPLIERARAEALENDPMANENKKAGKAFISKKAQDPASITTASGLVYKVLKEGQGANFTENDVVMTKYEGKHVDGMMFDNGEGQAVPFSCKQVIPGFAEMLKLMKPGMKVEVVIPSELAYGINGIKSPTGDTIIGPNETLVFTMETIGTQH